MAPNIMKWIIPVGLMVLGISARWMPHAPNFTPLLAIALYGGAFIQRSWAAYLLPLVVLVVSDLMLKAFYPEIYFVYGSFLLTVFIGRNMGEGFLGRTYGTLTAAVSFFLITNAASWFYSPTYAKSFAGLWQAYGAGIPFFRNTLASTIIFTAVLFLVHRALGQANRDTIPSLS